MSAIDRIHQWHYAIAVVLRRVLTAMYPGMQSTVHRPPSCTSVQADKSALATSSNVVVLHANCWHSHVTSSELTGAKLPFGQWTLILFWYFGALNPSKPALHVSWHVVLAVDPSSCKDKQSETSAFSTHSPEAMSMSHSSEDTPIVIDATRRRSRTMSFWKRRGKGREGGN